MKEIMEIQPLEKNIHLHLSYSQNMHPYLGK